MKIERFENVIYTVVIFLFALLLYSSCVLITNEDENDIIENADFKESLSLIR